MRLNERMKTSAFAASVLVPVLFFAGCAPGSRGTSEAVGTAPSGLNSSSPVPTPTTTSAQWASVIAPRWGSWTKNNLKWVSSGCEVRDARRGNEDCIRLLETMQDDVSEMHSKISSMADPEARTGYLGLPPVEIADAYEDLTQAIEGARQYVPFTCPGKKCLESALMFEIAWDSLGEAFTAWEPWL